MMHLCVCRHVRLLRTDPVHILTEEQYDSFCVWRQTSWDHGYGKPTYFDYSQNQSLWSNLCNVCVGCAVPPPPAQSTPVHTSRLPAVVPSPATPSTTTLPRLRLTAARRTKASQSSGERYNYATASVLHTI